MFFRKYSLFSLETTFSVTGKEKGGISFALKDRRRRQRKRLIQPTHLFRCHRWEACPILIQMVQFQIQGSRIQIQFLLVASGAFRSLLRSPCRWACGRRHIQSGCIRLLAFLNLLASLILILQAFLSLSLLQYLQ